MEVDLNKYGKIDVSLLGTIDASIVPEIISQESIYHYTSIAGLKGILSNKKIWFTHIDYMNDREEVIAGAEQLRRIGVGHYSGKYREIINEEVEKIRTQDHKTYIACFSMKRDELAMWNYYTKDVYNQGYNIGFDYRKLVVSILKSNPELHGCEFSFGRVDYCNGELEYAERFHDQSMHNLLHAVNAFLELVKTGEKVKEDVPCIYPTAPHAVYCGNEPDFKQRLSFDILYFMKRPCFLTEAEFRIVIEVPDSALVELKKSNKLQYRISNGLLVPYLDLSFDSDCLTGIALAPTINSDLAERSIKDYCRFCNIDINRIPEGIVKSEIPVRF